MFIVQKKIRGGVGDENKWKVDGIHILGWKQQKKNPSNGVQYVPLYNIRCYDSLHTH